MHMICYMSFYNGKDDISKVLENIKETAKIKNRELQITGALFFHDGQFLQIIEGKEDRLRNLMALIEKDDRHCELDYLIDTPVEKRGFSEWNMDSFILGEGHKFEREMMKSLTLGFEKNLLPRSDTLVYFYKTLLAQPTYKTKRMLSLIL